jgi:hypothetical protein
MIGCLGRHDRRSQIDDARALRISAQHHSCVGASPNHVLYVSTRIVATVSRAHRKIQSCRIVDRVGCQRPAKNLRAERVDECFAHDADAGRLGRAASEYHLDGRARISVGGRDVDWLAQHRRRHRDCNAKDADDLVCTHRSMLTQSSGPGADSTVYIDGVQSADGTVEWQAERAGRRPNSVARPGTSSGVFGRISTACPDAPVTPSTNATP